jgi:hypothetical protein
MESNEKKMTWRQLRDFCNSVPEEFINKNVHWVGEERGGIVKYAECFEEDMINPSGEGIEPVSAYTSDTDFDLSVEQVVFQKGEPAIWVD